LGREIEILFAISIPEVTAFTTVNIEGVEPSLFGPTE
jgi:hypothetical protein